MTVEDLTYWHWLIFGVALLILEIFAPGAFFLWLAIASAVVGGIVWLVPAMGWEYQLLLFSVLSVVSILIWRRYFRTQPAQTDQPALNRRGEQYVGRVFTLDEPIVNGLGKIRVDDSTWKIAGGDCESGARVKVVGVEGTLLRVDLAD
jgi:membrane protein implicated in regulation of membrane protease activity